jgi:hypothetical protein
VPSQVRVPYLLLHRAQSVENVVAGSHIARQGRIVQQHGTCSSSTLPKPYSWQFPAAMRVRTLPYGALCCVLGIRLCHIFQFETEFSRAMCALLSRCSSASVPLRAWNLQRSESVSMLEKRESALQAAVCAAAALSNCAQDAIKASLVVKQKEELVKQKEEQLANAARELTLAHADFAAAQGMEQRAKDTYDQLVADAQAVPPVSQLCDAAHDDDA